MCTVYLLNDTVERLVIFPSVHCVASADKDIEMRETAEAEIADLKMQLMALEDDVCLTE